MALKRLTPVIRRYDLGSIRMWQNELVEVVRLMSQLDGAEVGVVANEQYQVEDVESDLSTVGPRLQSFTVTAGKISEGLFSEFLKVDLSTAGCTMEATNPDLATLGAMNQMRSLTDECRLMPAWALRLYRDRQGERALGTPTLIAVIILAGVFTAVAAISNAVTHYQRSDFPLQTDIVLTIFTLILVYLFMLGLVRTRTVLYTGTRAESPIFWQEHRADIAINVGVGIIFFVLGLLAPHI
jgi:hypothetical protein